MRDLVAADPRQQVGLPPPLAAADEDLVLVEARVAFRDLAHAAALQAPRRDAAGTAPRMMARRGHRTTKNTPGALWGKPDWADRPEGQTPADWPNRKLWDPGTHYKYNDVRVNVLGINHYLTSDRFLHERADLFPPHALAAQTPNGNVVISWSIMDEPGARYPYAAPVMLRLDQDRALAFIVVGVATAP